MRSRSTGPSVASSSKPAYTSGCSPGGTIRTRRVAVHAAGGSRKTISTSYTGACPALRTAAPTTPRVMIFSNVSRSLTAHAHTRSASSRSSASRCRAMSSPTATVACRAACSAAQPR
ncbi:hypothetical protein ACPPVO_50115 [Dactylosporangium sp. McL0621]|uniref:hypothetical protein n=1 Tax=Dactylosporangium sp. McL0621 TaxID=3415678 RepID=UPI003CF2CA4B